MHFLKLLQTCFNILLIKSDLMDDKHLIRNKPHNFNFVSMENNCQLETIPEGKEKLLLCCMEK